MRLLARPQTFGPQVQAVARRETHGAFLFLAGEYAWKIKRAVRYSYMDFSTLERRRQALARELEINRRHAPSLYLGLVPITRAQDGSLYLGGSGEPVEWVLRMRRFDEAGLLVNVAARGALDWELARQLADVVALSHAEAPVRQGPGGAERLARLVEGVTAAMREMPALLAAETVALFHDRCRTRLARASGVLERRGLEGSVRRCHGDLHLGNIVLLDDRPTLFDALEFDEDLATIDTLYDLAFLLMDLEHGGHAHAANIVLNRYLWRTGSVLDLDGLAALPLFLGLRAGVRALVRAQHAAEPAPPPEQDRRAAEMATAHAYLVEALGHLDPPAPRLVAIGGLSGTGKSTLARRLAPAIGARPGAIHLRSDLERKAMFGVGETERLGSEAYTEGVSRHVYLRVIDKARRVLAAGHAVVVDAVLAGPEERAAVEALAAGLDLPLAGLWLNAPRNMLLERVAGRSRDASDADARVVEMQLERDPGPGVWQPVDASGGPEETAARAATVLGLQLGPGLA